MEHPVKIKSIEHVTHDVLRIVTEKPPSLSFKPGQAADISINKVNWQTEKRPFTFTSLPNYTYLEFTIKTYPSRKGVTNELLKLKKHDELIVADVFGDIAYKGKGVFIAGGAGVTPFIAIFRISMRKMKSEITSSCLPTKQKPISFSNRNSKIHWAKISSIFYQMKK